MDRLERTPLSDRDIYNKLKGKTNILMYKQLNDVDYIEQILIDNSVVILYENKPNRGHWLCIIRHWEPNKDKPTLEFFDSYGFFPDDEKRLIRNDFLQSSHQKHNKISELLYEASDRYNIEYNDFHLQKKDRDIATCGRHVISRIKLKELGIDEYNKFIKSFKKHKLNADDVVTIISEII